MTSSKIEPLRALSPSRLPFRTTVTSGLVVSAILRVRSSMCIFARSTFPAALRSGCVFGASLLMEYPQTMTEKTQKTRQGTEIFVPKRKDFLKDLRKTARTKPTRSTTGARPKK